MNHRPLHHQVCWPSQPARKKAQLKNGDRSSYLADAFTSRVKMENCTSETVKDVNN
jgi:hypothetical protein